MARFISPFLGSGAPRSAQKLIQTATLEYVGRQAAERAFGDDP
jgi:hypothetical protein